MLDCGGKLGDSKENSKEQDPVPFPRQKDDKSALVALFALWLLLMSCLESPGEQVKDKGKKMKSSHDFR